ncbi:hypothetical protein Patl1_16433 [Pistacia atlantica]|uniref:Uncharacterized protein n=1 Tax=Pistacia atlantica TaxID=434234 RepID=A0ACC1B735_9ROSI|nr:hypothetical protein Patl1_16433 [Pistacia atlantica]
MAFFGFLGSWVSVNIKSGCFGSVLAVGTIGCIFQFWALVFDVVCGVFWYGLLFSTPLVLISCVEALSKWETKDARVMTWILSSVEPHLVLNLKPYKTAIAMWNYLNTFYNQNNFTRLFQLEYEMANFTQGSLSIEEYFSGFQPLWIDYSDIVYANVPTTTLSTIQAMHATSKRDQFLMKLRPDFEIGWSNMMNRHPVSSLDACLSELLREEQCIVTQAAVEHRANVGAPVSMAYAAQGRNKGRDMHVVQCFSCKAFGHIARDCPKKFCNYCKKQGHIISACPIRPERKQGTVYHASTGASSSIALPAASLVVPIPPPTALANPNTLTLEMDQVSGKMIAKGPKVG